MRNLLQDVRFGLRNLRRSPAFTSVAILSLALGIGANTAIFSVIDALLLRSLPVRAPQELVLFGDGRAAGITAGLPNDDTRLFSEPFYRTVRDGNAVFTSVAAEDSMTTAVHARFTADAEPEKIRVRLVSGAYFPTLDVATAAGRLLTPEDDSAKRPVAVMSFATWERRFGRRPDAIGRSFQFNNTVFTIVGVAAPEFTGTSVGESVDFWIPLAMVREVQPWFNDPHGSLSQSLWLIGRTRPGVTMAAAQANVNVVFQQWLHAVAGSHPSAEQIQDIQRARITMTDASKGLSGSRRDLSEPLKILMAAVGVVILIACANIANLLLARAAGRTREISVRLALGATRRRLIAQLLTESGMLAIAGGVLGLLAGWWGGQLLVASGPAAFHLNVEPNPRVLLFTFGLALATGLLFGIFPAFRLTQPSLAATLAEGKGSAKTQSRSLLGHSLVAGQVALALILLVCAGLFLRTLRLLTATDVGFDKNRVTIFELDSGANGLKPEQARRIEERVLALPGVESTSFSMLTFERGSWISGIWPEGVAHTEATAQDFDGNRVGPDYFRTMGMRLVAGRAFEPQDTPQSQRVAVVNETLARKLYPDGSAVGRRFSRAGEDHFDFLIVGVVKDAKYHTVREKQRGVWFVSTEQERDGFGNLMVRWKPHAVPAVAQVRAVIRDQDANLAVSLIANMADRVNESLSREKLLATLASIFGGLALLLSAIGLYGVIAYSVARRVNEIGIRMALGARPVEVLRMVLLESLTVVGVGLAVGIPAALACGRLVSSQLYNVAPNDLLSLAGAACLLTIVALVASFLPARRAALLDPLVALREE
jgi:predicted permease